MGDFVAAAGVLLLSHVAHNYVSIKFTSKCMFLPHKVQSGIRESLESRAEK